MKKKLPRPSRQNPWADLAENESVIKPPVSKPEPAVERTNLFDEEPKNNKTMMLMIAGAIAFVIIVGAVWGILSSMSSKPAGSNSSAANTSSSNSATVSVPSSETTSGSTAPATVPSSETSETAANPSAVKKAAAPQATPQVKKTATPQAKPSVAPTKKAVTVDDLINDN